MMYLDAIADDIRQRVSDDLLPDEDTSLLFRLYALLALSKGGAVSAADVHNAWALWIQERDPSHRSLKPFAELDAATQAADEPFVEAIRAVAERIERIPA